MEEAMINTGIHILNPSLAFEITAWAACFH